MGLGPLFYILLGFRVQGLGELGFIIPTRNDVILVTLIPYKGDPNGNEDGTHNRNWTYIRIYSDIDYAETVFG